MEAPLELPIPSERVVFFDGACNLCSGSVRFVLRHNEDRTIDFASMQSALGRRVLERHGLSTDDYDSMLYVERGRLYAKSAAALKIAERLTLPWRLLRFLAVVPEGARDWLYDRVARNRYRLFGRRDRCFLPDAEVLDRFVGE